MSGSGVAAQQVWMNPRGRGTHHTHPRGACDQLNADFTTPSGLYTLVAYLPSSRARIRFFEKSSALLVSLHEMSTPWLSVLIATAPCANVHPVPAATAPDNAIGT